MPVSSPTYRIAVNTRHLIAGKLEGIGWFEYQILRRWVLNYPQHEFIFIFDRPFSEEFIFGPNVTPVVLDPPARHPLLWYIWYEYQIPRLLKKLNVDIFVSLDAYTSISTTVPRLTALHDIAFEFFDRQMPPMAQWFMRHFTSQYVCKSDRILTVSQASKQDIISHFGCNPDKIIVAHNAASEAYKPASIQDNVSFRREYTEGKPYFVFVGSVHPRKNVLNLLKAYELYRSSYTSDDKLVIIGRLAWQYDQELKYLERMVHKEDVQFVPHSSPSEISRWLSASTALAFVSHYEGFGVPIVEALSSGTPVITSNISSMPEVAGPGAITVDPNNVKDIAKAMLRLTSDSELRQQMVKEGQNHISKYTWDSAANIAWDALIKTLVKGT